MRISCFLCNMYGKKKKKEKINKIRKNIEKKWEAIPYEKNVICRKKFFCVH